LVSNANVWLAVALPVLEEAGTDSVGDVKQIGAPTEPQPHITITNSPTPIFIICMTRGDATRLPIGASVKAQSQSDSKRRPNARLKK
jgi:hypothetical protein